MSRWGSGRLLRAGGAFALATGSLSAEPLPQSQPASSAAEVSEHAAPSSSAALALVRADEEARVAALAKAAQSVVCIFDSRQLESGGSGVIIHADGYGLTNFHVVESFLDSRQGFGGMSDGKLYPLRVLGIDPGGDLVMFKLAGRDRFEAAELGDSDQVRVGQWVAALGNPFILADNFSPTLTLGIVSGVRRYQEGQQNLLEYADCIQVSTSINPGNSGGPLFDLTPRVIGINGRASFEERGRVNVGLGYAISSNQVKRFMPGLRAGRLVEHGTLGLTVRRAGASVIIDAIQALSPAEQAGLALGDQVREVAGRSIATPNDYNNILGTLPAGWPVVVRVLRGEREVVVTARTERVTLGAAVVYAPDMEHNWSEMRRAMRVGQAPFLRSRAAPDFVESELRIGSEGSEALVLSVHTKLGPAEAPSATLGSIGNSGPDAIEAEWGALVRLLLTPFTPRFGDEMLGGDELDGRMVEVHQRRLADELMLQWLFDAESGELAGVRFMRAAAPCSTWQPLLADGWFPNGWRRTDASAVRDLQMTSLKLGDS